MVRLAVEEDVEDILEIYKPYVEETTISFEWETPAPDVFKSRFQTVTAQFPWLVYEEEGRIAGYAYPENVFQRKAYQWSVDMAVYIHPGDRKRGIGARLYRAVEELLKLQGYVNAYALVTQGNQASIAFHKAVGYTEVARFPHVGFKMGQWLEVVWLQKTLSECPSVPEIPKGIKEIDPEKVREIMKVYSEYEK